MNLIRSITCAGYYLIHQPSNAYIKVNEIQALMTKSWIITFQFGNIPIGKKGK
jgi:hypothetical protein